MCGFVNTKKNLEKDRTWCYNGNNDHKKEKIMKIIVVGAGIGGTYFASLMSKQGHDVTIIEKEKCVEDLRYDQCDDVDIKVFQEHGIPVPEGSYPKRNWTFAAGENTTMNLIQRYENIDYTIDRKRLNDILFSLIGDTKVMFGCEVTKAITNEKNRVIGVVVSTPNGQKNMLADLIIDASGVNSSVRTSLEKTCGFPKIDKESMFYAFRGFFRFSEFDAKPTRTNMVYMKQLGQKGISWCVYDEKERVADILVGRVGGLSKEQLNACIDDLRRRNPYVGKEIVRAGHVAIIPVRRPLSKLVHDGYVLLGDSACMTIPMIGSGIATSIISAKILFDLLNKNASTDISNLWNYQVEVMRKFGAEHAGVEIVKNWMLEKTVDEVEWAFYSGILENSDMQDISVGRLPNITLKGYLKKAWAGMDRPKLLFGMAGILGKAKQIKKFALAIPTVYDEVKAKKWGEKYDKFYLY